MSCGSLCSRSSRQPCVETSDSARSRRSAPCFSLPTEQLWSSGAATQSCTCGTSPVLSTSTLMARLCRLMSWISANRL
eukprot:30046_1